MKHFPQAGHLWATRRELWEMAVRWEPSDWPGESFILTGSDLTPPSTTVVTPPLSELWLDASWSSSDTLWPITSSVITSTSTFMSSCGGPPSDWLAGSGWAGLVRRGWDQADRSISSVSPETGGGNKRIRTDPDSEPPSGSDVVPAVVARPSRQLWLVKSSVRCSLSVSCRESSRTQGASWSQQAACRTTRQQVKRMKVWGRGGTERFWAPVWSPAPGTAAQSGSGGRTAATGGRSQSAGQTLPGRGAEEAMKREGVSGELQRNHPPAGGAVTQQESESERGEQSSTQSALHPAGGGRVRVCSVPAAGILSTKRFSSFWCGIKTFYHFKKDKSEMACISVPTLWLNTLYNISASVLEF